MIWPPQNRGAGSFVHRLMQSRAAPPVIHAEFMDSRSHALRPDDLPRGFHMGTVSVPSTTPCLDLYQSATAQVLPCHSPDTATHLHFE